MDFDAWRPTYEAILADFGWHAEADAHSARHLQTLVPNGAWRHVGTELKNRPRAIIVGCGPQLEDLRASALPQGVVVAADGATTRLRELGIIPRVVVTDLDGDPEALCWAAQQGSSMVVHAHGDNQERLDLVQELGPLVAGSCQGDPAGLEPLRNHGGFTDGDRAALLCEAMHVRDIALACFDFEAPPSRYSHHYNAGTKARKLAWAKRILEAAVGRGAPIRML